MTFFVVLKTQMWRIKLKSSILIIRSDAQNRMLEFGFGCTFHDLNCFEVRIFFQFSLIHYRLEGIITKFCGKPSV